MDQLQPDLLLGSLPLKYYVIDLKSKRIVQTNDASVKDKNGTCFKMIFDKDLPCNVNGDQCICQQMLKKTPKPEFVIDSGYGLNKRFFKTNISALKEDLVLVNYTEITEQVNSGKELKINSRRLIRAQKLANFGYWEFNIDDKVVHASSGAVDIYGVSGSPIPLGEVQSIPLPKYRKLLDKSLINLIHKNQPYNVRYEIQRPEDGEIRYIRSIAEYRQDKRMVFGVLHDMTEHEMSQKALIESEKNFQLLFQNMNSAFAYHQIITNDKGEPVDYVFLDVNGKFEELTNLKRDDIIGKSALEVLPEIESHWIERYGKVALTGESEKFTDYEAAMGKYFEIAAYSPKIGYFAVTFTDITNRIKSEKALDESLRDLKMAQGIAKIGNWQFDPQTAEILWSDEVYKIFERNPELGSIDPKEIKSAFGESNYKQFYSSGELAVKNGTPFQFQFNMNLANGKRKWIEIICKPESEKDTGRYSLRGTIQDINDSKLVEVELDNSNKLLRTVIDNIPDAIYMKDNNFRKLVANKGDASHSGIDNVSDMIGKSDYDLYPKQIAEMYIADDKKVMESGKAVINREEILPFADKFRWVLTSKIPLKTDDNKVFGLVGIGRDITEIKEQQSKLRLLQQTIEQSPISVVITDINGIIEYVNPEFEKTTGYTREEAIGKNPRILKSGEQSKAYYKNLWDTIRSGENWHGEFHNRRKDGTMYWESAVIAPIYNERNELKQFVAIKEDVTRMKHMISELEIAKEKAEESDRLKTIFLANMSHEIRTPLNGILGFSNIICSGLSEKDKLQKYGKIIENSGRRLMTVIDDIIDISMIQSNQLKIDNEKFNINELLEELYIVYKTQNSTKLQNIELEVELCENREHGIIISDKNRVFQIYKNLLDNAFKFTEKGMIKFGCMELNNDMLRLYVEDTGIGIAKEKTKIIFESFRQVEEGDSRKYDGSGLGLAIITGIIEKMGGEIEVLSEVNKGSIFYVTLPRNNKMNSGTLNHTNKSEALKNLNGKKGPKRIVSFEDDNASYQYLKTITDLMGCELVNFDSAHTGLEYLKKNKVDLVLMDVQLPEMNGFDATRLIKAEFPDLPVIIQTAFALKEDKDRAFQAGCDEYISKPVSMKSLKEKIEKLTEFETEEVEDR